MDDILISTDNKGGRAYLTTSSPVSHYGIPILRIEAEDIDGDFGPSDIIDGTMTSADIIVGWAKRPGRTNDELIAARKFLGQWPEGPQLHGGKREGAGRKPSGRGRKTYYVTDREHQQIKRLIEKMREEETMYKVETIGYKNGEYLPGTETELYIGKDKDEARAAFDAFSETESMTAIGSKLEDAGRWEIIWEK